MIWPFVGVFAVTFTLDFVWAWYTHAITARRALAASNYAAMIILLSGIGVVAYSTNPWLLLPGVAGAWLGTYTAIKRGVVGE